HADQWHPRHNIVLLWRLAPGPACPGCRFRNWTFNNRTRSGRRSSRVLDEPGRLCAVARVALDGRECNHDGSRMNGTPPRTRYVKAMHTASRPARFCLLLVAATLHVDGRIPSRVQDLPGLTAPSGLQLLVDQANVAPTLRVLLPGRPDSDRSIVILFPEHVTGVRLGRREGQQLYRWEPGARDDRPAWVRTDQSIGYDGHLPGLVKFVARAT